MSKMQEALAEYGYRCQVYGKYEGDPDYEAQRDAAEAAVLALYEKQKAIADELAGALRSISKKCACDCCLGDEDIERKACVGCRYDNEWHIHNEAAIALAYDIEQPKEDGNASHF